MNLCEQKCTVYLQRVICTCFDGYKFSPENQRNGIKPVCVGKNNLWGKQHLAENRNSRLIPKKRRRRNRLDPELGHNASIWASHKVQSKKFENNGQETGLALGQKGLRFVSDVWRKCANIALLFQEIVTISKQKIYNNFLESKLIFCCRRRRMRGQKRRLRTQVHERDRQLSLFLSRRVCLESR